MSDTAEAAAAFRRLVEVMELLRGPDGCPWDREQTYESLVPALIEEAYEVVEAVESANPRKIRDELGDLLLLVVFYGQIGSEEGDFETADSIRAICEKLERRHPHVFSDATVRDSDEVLDRWHEIKKSEEAHRDRDSALDGVPRALPALMRAQDVQKKAARVGFDWDEVGDTLGKIREEADELADALGAGDADRLCEEVGDILFSAVNLARKLRIDAEYALSLCTGKFIARFRYIEEELARRGSSPAEVDLAEMDALWEKAKGRPPAE